MRKKINREKVIAMYKAGASYADIAVFLHCSINSINAIIWSLKKAGVITRRKFDNVKQGEKHNRAKLTELQIREIIDMRAKGMKYGEIAAIFKIHPCYPSQICAGKAWKKITKKR